MSSPQTGSQTFVGIKKETVRNTAELVPNVILKVDSNNVQLVKERVLDEIMWNDRDNNYNEYTVSGRVEGDITGKVRNEDIGDLIFLAMGKVTSVQEATSGAYKHTFIRLNTDVSNNLTTQLPSFTFFHTHGPAGYYKAYGCVADMLKIEIGETETKFTLSIKGIAETKITDSTQITNIKAAVAYTDSEHSYNFGNLTVRYADNYAGLAASTNFLNVSPGVTINIQNNCVYDYATTSVANAYLVPFDILAGKFQAGVETSGWIVRDSNIRDWFDADTKKAYSLKLNSENAGGIELGTTSGLYPLIDFRIPSTLPVVSVDKPLNEHVKYNVSFPNLINTIADGKSFEIYLQNEKSGY